MNQRTVSEGYFTLWTGWTPLAVFRASNMRGARSIAESRDLLRELHKARVSGKPLLAEGDRLWVGLANEADRSVYDSAQKKDQATFVWLAQVDQ